MSSAAVAFTVAGSALVVLAWALAWAIRLRRALAGERSVAERERAAARRERAVAAARGKEVAHLDAVRADLDDAARRERMLRDSVQSSFESVARNMHAMSMVQQQVLDGLGQRIGDAELMGEVMKADHAAAQMTRKAQTLLVMCGIWPARRETRPVTLFDCVRGAQSRIVEFGRVEVHGGQTLYAVAPAVEGLMHAIAELLENATVYSPSRTQVVVNIREVAAGAVVEIDDAGLGMPQDALQRAVAQLREGLDLAELGAVPRLGLACVGRWSQELGFGVELSSASAYGGTRVVVFVPHRLLTEPSGGAPETEAEPVLVEPAAPETAVPPAPPATLGLPQRRNRRRTAGSGSRAATPTAAAPTAATPPSTATGSEGGEAATAPGGGSADPSWTPEAARASVASVVTGSRRGRAEAAEAARTEGAEGAEAANAAEADGSGHERVRDHGPDDREGGR